MNIQTLKEKLVVLLFMNELAVNIFSAITCFRNFVPVCL